MVAAPELELSGGAGGGALPMLPTMATSGKTTGTSPNPLINAGVDNNLFNNPTLFIDPAGDSVIGGGNGYAPMPTPTAASFPNANITPNATDLGHDFISVSPQSPDFTKALFGYLQSMIGKGATPYGGQLSADQNNLLQQLVAMLSGGQSSIPGAGTLTDMATTGDPINQVPAWQAMVDAAQRSIAQGRANLRESFAFGGNLAGSPFGTASADYESQTAKDLNAQLEQMTATALENAAGRKLNASEFTAGMASDTSKYVQGLDQAALDRLYQEFMRTQPEYSPLLNLQYGAATTYPPTLHPPAGLGILGALLGNAGGIADALSKLGIKLPGAPPAQPTTGTQYPPGTPRPTPEPAGQTGGAGNIPPGATGLPGHEGWSVDPNTGLMVPPGYGADTSGFGGFPIGDSSGSTPTNPGDDWVSQFFGTGDSGSSGGSPEPYYGDSGGGGGSSYDSGGSSDWWDMGFLGDFSGSEGGY